MNKKCPNCQLVNFSSAEFCRRCNFYLGEAEIVSVSSGFLRSKFFKRALILVFACIFALFGFYFSLIFSADKLTHDETIMVEQAINVLEQKGFSGEVFLLRYVTAFRGNDNWLNALVVKENAYAATNFPFEIMTVYPDFFTVTMDDTERASILLHEAKHLQGADEKEAYEFVWKNRKQLGWTKETHYNSIIWRSVRKQTKEYAPNLFVCDLNEFADCTE
jgi:hypothetical protein